MDEIDKFKVRVTRAKSKKVSEVKITTSQCIKLVEEIYKLEEIIELLQRKKKERKFIDVSGGKF